MVRASPTQSSSLSKADRSRVLVEAVASIRDYAIFLLDQEGYILTWNEGARQLEGYSEDEIIGRHISELYLPADRARGLPQSALKEAKKIGRCEMEGWRVRKGGTAFWASVTINKTLDADGRFVGFSNIIRDHSDRKRAEDKLRETEERYRTMIESVKDYAIFMLDLRGYVATWNEGARRIKGYEPKEIIGKHFSIFYPEEDANSGKCEYELNEATLTGRYEEEAWRVRKDGTLFLASVVITAVRDSNRNLVGFTKVTRDLTERKRNEEKLARANADLERRVNERTQSLAEANRTLEARERELEKAVKIRDDFLSIASHELKTPITSLKIQLQLLKERAKGEAVAGSQDRQGKMRRAIELSLRQVDRLVALIEDHLDASRTQAGKLSFQFEKADLREIARETLERLAQQASDRGNTFRLLADEPVVGYVDRFRIDQVLENLVSNSLRYAPGAQVRVRIEKEESIARIIVQDEGPGIPKEEQAVVFGKFERGSGSGGAGGLGLGLFICRQIVEGHHGTIDLESEPGKGVKFTIEIPLNLLRVGASEVQSAKGKERNPKQK